MTRWRPRLFLCLLAVVAVAMTAGCGMFSPERNQRRADIMGADLRRIPDEVDWILGFDQASTLSEKSFPPYAY